MKIIGLIGGLSWESTATYYTEINRGVREVLGGLHSAKLLLHSFDFAEIAALQTEAGWPEAGQRLADAGRNLEASGADCLLICSNLMHRVAPAVQSACGVEVIHIADALGEALQAAGVKSPLLLATRSVMQALVPDAQDRQEINRIIFDELVRGVISPQSKAVYLEAVRKGRQAGADSVVFACTEIGLLLSPADMDCPSFDTAKLHAQAAVAFALNLTPSQR